MIPSGDHACYIMYYYMSINRIQHGRDLLMEHTYDSVL